jgi:putative flippase GtrA
MAHGGAVKGVVREYLVYALGAAAGFAVDIGLLAALVEVGGLHYLLAATISFLAGTAVVYWVSIRHAFTHRRIADARKEFTLFAAIGGVGIVLNLSVMFAMVEGLGAHYLVAKIVAAGASFTANFGLRRWMLFSQRPDRKYPTDMPKESH